MQLFRNKITVGIFIASQFLYGVPAYASEPNHVVHGRAPVASNLVLDKPVPAIGDTVRLSYSFQDLDGDAEQGTIVQWLRDTLPIQGATSFSYTLNEAEGDRPGQVLRVEVTPKTDPNVSEPSVGQMMYLETFVAGDRTAKPQVKVTDIKGVLNVGSTLAGEYNYDDGGSGSGDASIKSWLNGGHQSSEAEYLLTQEDVGLVLTFRVQAQNLQGTTGNTDSMNTTAAAGVSGGNGNGGVVDLVAGQDHESPGHQR
ncbi:hypothetical protein KHO49_17410 [Pseudomonas sp. RC4D1]|uniref:hypothetical protein n=1 Tax=Pseudomonas sp. RC4D1 TaxID=2834407 RepID=UPI001BCF64E5|nr:hypothetical protein [Pseudomonas sp. RC4D1]MBS7560120.1 hypothetical protein [Pseudomonas sp. RC4D1]